MLFLLCVLVCPPVSPHRVYPVNMIESLTIVTKKHTGQPTSPLLFLLLLLLLYVSLRVPSQGVPSAQG